MLASLYVKNYILIDEQQICFGEGLNIITGETGAGKSILLDALAAVLGESPSKDKIRSGENRAVFEAVFRIAPTQEIRELLAENEIDIGEGELIIRRELNDTGRSRSFINDTPVPLPVLIKLGDLMIDMHGQHEHQLLLQPSRHIDYLDAYARHEDLLAETRAAFQALKESLAKLDELIAKQREIERSRDLLHFQYNEIAAVNPSLEEEEELLREEKILRNAERLQEAALKWYGELYEKDGAAVEVLSAAAKNLAELSEIDAAFQEIAGECENAAVMISDAARMLQRYASKVLFDNDRLEAVRQRLAALTGLKKKYGGTLQAVLEHFARIRAELGAAENLQEEIARLEAQTEEQRRLLGELSLKLSHNRRAAAESLSRGVCRELAALGMPDAEFSVLFTQQETDGRLFVRNGEKKIAVTGKGTDRVEFMIRTNRGETMKPLAEVASGGEISRVMLALKSCLAAVDQVPVLVFDEIDSGVSGRIAQAVGVSLRKLAAERQVICITHLPQIASMADHHFLVEKTSDELFVRTTIRELSQEERREQIARLFGGERVTEAHLQSAAELMQEAERLSRLAN
ncbi:MAG: DNA repair protein RecN [candidate division KSB1 bacterium]|nr:DNA repair protein RecN [candidate division KSB1 bacterium]